MTSLAADRPTGAVAAIGGARAAEEREHRLRQLVDQHYDFVWRSLRRLGVPPADAEDAAQEVFVSLSRRLDDVELGSERGFLYRAAVNHAAHAHRTRVRRREVSAEGLEERAAPTPNPEELLQGSRQRALFHRALEALDLELRAVFVLYELEQMTMGEIASTLEIPSGTVASRLRRARAVFVERARILMSDASGREP